MKIRRLTNENHGKVEGLLRQVFSGSAYELRLFQNLHANKRELLEWICIHKGSVIAYIAFSNAYNNKQQCGLHLAPLAVKPEMQYQGIGSELLRFALRQDCIQKEPIYVLGDIRFYAKFGFQHCHQPLCPFDNKNKHFSSIRTPDSSNFTIGYEPEFSIGL